MTAPVPPMDPRPLLTMVDMGMGKMSAMENSAPGGMSGMANAPAEPMSGMSGMSGENGAMKMENPPAASATGAAPGMSDMSGMSSMAAAGSAANSRGAGTTGDATIAPMSGTTPFPQPGPATTGPAPMTSDLRTVPARPLALHKGPQVDNVAA